MNWDEYSKVEKTMESDEKHQFDYDGPPRKVENIEHFTEYFGLDEMSQRESMIRLLYFSFTSLTTVGFGDFNPRSDAERLFIAFGLLFGVALFSYIMGEFIEMVQKRLKYEAHGDGEELARFFGLLKYFNDADDFDPKVQANIEQYFEYRWDNDKNMHGVDRKLNE